MTCTVCFEGFTLALRKCTTCAYCDAKICRICLQQYLLADTATEPNCPSCRKNWDRDYLNDNLTAAFRNGPFKKHREKVLMDRERARFPDTQENAIVYKNAKEHIETACIEAESLKKKKAYQTRHERKAKNAAAREYNDLIHTVRKTLMPEPKPQGFVYHTWYAQTQTQLAARPEIQASWAIYEEARKTLEAKEAPHDLLLRPAEQMVGEYHYAIRTYGLVINRHAQVAKTDKPARAVFTQKCPTTDCEGFLSTQWKCGLCDGSFCKDCHETKADDHECNPDLVASVKAIKKEAKPCPRCASQISKIDGCDQMWCTQCHTAFSWNTGNIETHVVHNPHYFQWMRENGNILPRAPGDNPDPNIACGGVNSLLVCLRQIRTANQYIPATTKFVDNMYENIRSFQHITQIEIPRLRRILDQTAREDERRQMRVKRMVNEITDEEWKKTLQRDEKEQLRTQSRLQLLEMYATAGMEIIGQLQVNPNNIDTVCKQLTALYQFTETSNRKISKAYGCTPLKISMSTDVENVQYVQ